MKIKRMVKRLFAVGAGATMLGATAMGAMAADLNEYPGMFVTDGTFNGFLVVGENAQPIDNLAMTDIAASMKTTSAAAATTTTTTVEGDAWLVGTSSKKLEIANNNNSDSSIVGETFRDITTFISEEELVALADGTYHTNENEYGYQQFLYFDPESSAATSSQAASRIVKFTESDDTDVTADHLFLQSNGQIGRYRLEFTSNAQSDVTDSAGSADTTGTYLDDFEDTELIMAGKAFSIVQARRRSSGGDANQAGVTLTLMSGSTRATMLEGETQSFTIGDKDYEVTLSFVDTDEAKFTVNGEATNKLKDGETFVLADKSEVGVSEILYQDYAGGLHSSTFYLGARKTVWRDDDVRDSGSSHLMQVGSEDIDGAHVYIEGTDNNVTFALSTINLNMTADSSFFVASGGTLRETIDATGDEEEVLMDGALDLKYTGLSDETTNEIGLKTSTVRRYKLAIFDGDGNSIKVPVAYAEAQYNVSLGQDSWSGTRTNNKRLKIAEGSDDADGGEAEMMGGGDISKDDYFIVTGGSAPDGSAKTYLLQYRGADRSTKTSPKIKFKNEGNSETLEYSAATTSGSAGLVATIKLGGYSFIVQNATVQTSDDYEIDVDLDSSGAVGSNKVNIVDYYGGQWYFTQVNLSVAQGKSGAGGNGGGGVNSTDQLSIQLQFGVLDGNDYDNIAPTNFTLNITSASGPELRAALTGLTLLTPEGETTKTYGYTSAGAYFFQESPSGDPQELTITYPSKQRLPQVYVTSGATTTSTAATGDLVAVEIVDATKLDSEVADADAQNLIVVGGPCVNTVAADLLGNPAECTEGFTPGKARVKLFEHANGNMAMLVAGYSGADTRLAGKVIAHRWQEFSGSEVEVEGTTYSDATISSVSS